MTKTRQAHPAAQIFPMMQKDELQRLADDIKQYGQREKVLVTKDDMILDGRNRAAACKLVGKVLRTEKWPGKPGTELEVVLSRNIHRRHLDESQRAMAAALAAPMVKGLDLGGEKVANLPPDRRAKTAEKLGAMFHVSERSVRYAMKITKSPRLCKGVQSGEFKVSAVYRLADLPDAELCQKLAERRKPKERTQIGTAETMASPMLPSYEVDLNSPEFDVNLARPNLASDATVVIKADSLQIGAAVALLLKWQIPVTEVLSERGDFKGGAIHLIGGQLRVRAGRAPRCDGSTTLQLVVA